MITEDYVSFETAKLLKEKGFDETLYAIYDIDGTLDANHCPFSNTTECAGFECVAPTLQMAMKWLREVYNCAICISPYWPEGDMRNKLTWDFTIHSLIDNRSFRECNYMDNYEQACEAAIKYCLENLI